MKPRRRTLQERLYQELRQGLLQGVLAPGTRLPAARALAAERGVARGTVDQAYARLVLEGFLVTRGPAGTFVRDPLPVPAPPRRPAPRPASAAPRPAGRAPRPLQLGVPAVEAFPVATWARLLGRRSRLARASDLVRPEPEGVWALREAIAAHLAVARGVVARPEQVLVTGGYQGSLGLVLQALAQPGQLAWMEAPGSFRTRQALALAGLQVAEVPVDREGLRVEQGVAVAPRARLAFVTPTHQMPLGVALSLPRRLALLAWARRAGALVVEDDYDGEFHYDSAPLPALRSLDPEGPVLYAGTFSKTTVPALRLGFLVVPDQVRPALARAADLLQSAPAAAVQWAMADFLAGGHYARHVRRMRHLYAGRRAALASALEALGSPRLRVEVPPGGLHLLAWLRGVDEVEAVAGAERAGLAPGWLSLHRGGGPDPGAALLLGFATVPTGRSAEVARRLVAAVEAAGARLSGPARAGSVALPRRGTATGSARAPSPRRRAASGPG